MARLLQPRGCRLRGRTSIFQTQKQLCHFHLTRTRRCFRDQHHQAPASFRLQGQDRRGRHFKLATPLPKYRRQRNASQQKVRERCRRQDESRSLPRLRRGKTCRLLLRKACLHVNDLFQCPTIPTGTPSSVHPTSTSAPTASTAFSSEQFSAIISASLHQLMSIRKSSVRWADYHGYDSRTCSHSNSNARTSTS